MNKLLYVSIIVVLIGVLAGGYVYFNRTSIAYPVSANVLPPAGPNAKGRGPIVMSSGTNLKTSPLFQYAYQIVPSNASVNTKEALIGFAITTQDQNDGSIVVTLTPKDSEGQSQLYTVKSGQTLYFIEQTPADDKADQDKDLNYRDDYGIIVDSNGIIQ
jgi:hypothetical protein